MNIKKILALLLVIAMAVLMLSACGEKEKPSRITADNLPKGKVLLSTLSNEEITEFLAKHGVTVPDELNDIDLSDVLSRMESDIDYPWGYTISYVNLAKLYRNIHSVIVDYYEIG